MEDAFPAAGEDLRYSVWEYVECQLLRREAEQLILGKNKIE